MKHYLIDVWGLVEPTAVGPFDTAEIRDAEALETRKRQREEDALFWADVDENGELRVGAYSNGFFIDGIPEYDG